MSVAATRRAGKRIALRYGQPHRKQTAVEMMGGKKGAKIAGRK